MPESFILLLLLAIRIVKIPGCLAEGESCPQLGKNMELLRQSKDYARSPGSQSYSNDFYHADGAAVHSYRSDIRAAVPAEDFSYLTLPIFDIATIEAANGEASELEKSGKIEKAKKIRLRIKNACTEQFGFEVYAEFKSQHDSSQSASLLYERAAKLRDAVAIKQKLKK